MHLLGASFSYLISPGPSLRHPIHPSSSTSWRLKACTQLESGRPGLGDATELSTFGQIFLSP